jgi:hypothetical protein
VKWVGPAASDAKRLSPLWLFWTVPARKPCAGCIQQVGCAHFAAPVQCVSCVTPALVMDSAGALPPSRARLFRVVQAAAYAAVDLQRTAVYEP